jgi:D-lactate dehydrogenase (cytochrome)
MQSHRIRTRPVQGDVRAPALQRGEDIATFLQDAARTPGGHAPLLAVPENEGQIAWVLREAPAVLPIGAQSSLTGGATPFGEWLLATTRLSGIGAIDADRVWVGAGVALTTLEDALRDERLFYPPAPTFRGACVGGMVATNAAGAVTFKYGTTRSWVRALTVVLASGEALDVERGQCRAHKGGYFEIERLDGESTRVPLPTYRLPDVPKCSAGYYAESEMDLVDLFIGSEGTLGVITSVALGLAPEPTRFWAFSQLPDEGSALRLVDTLRSAARATWAAHDPLGVDVAAIESLDARCLALLREDGQDRAQQVRLDPAAGTALLVELELPQGTTAEVARAQLASAHESGSDGPLVRLVRILEAAGAVDDLELALPGDLRRARQFFALREAVPEAVNRRVGDVQRTLDARVHKTAGDMIVPFAALPAMLARYREAFSSRALDHAIWGHISDGNLHANVIPRSYADVEQGYAALRELGQEALRLGGCPLSEHGVGRNPLKQAFLRELYGDEGLQAMRRVKDALDPLGKLSPGVLFPIAPGMQPRREA